MPFNISLPLVGQFALLTSLVIPLPLKAQALEEIVVTAQRREQSLQDVPLSIEAFSGETIQNQNFRGMQELGNFSPTVIIEGGQLETNVRIHGIGTSGRTFTLEQAVPTFVDGVHYGRASQIKTAFLDVERVEVLKGPQPIYFGQNATAGAFNITSRKPTPEWEGYGKVEYGNFNEHTFEAAAGGPVTDTFGVRLAAKYESGEGFITDIVTDEKLGLYKNKGGRAILQWTPSDNFEITAKFEASDLKGSRSRPRLCHGKTGSCLTRRNPAVIRLRKPSTGQDRPHRSRQTGNWSSIWTTACQFMINTSWVSKQRAIFPTGITGIHGVSVKSSGMMLTKI